MNDVEVRVVEESVATLPSTVLSACRRTERKVVSLSQGARLTKGHERMFSPVDTTDVDRPTH